MKVLNDEPGLRPPAGSATSTSPLPSTVVSPTTARIAPVDGSTDATTATVDGFSALIGLFADAASASICARWSIVEVIVRPPLKMR